jgi:hypothetical protein
VSEEKKEKEGEEGAGRRSKRDRRALEQDRRKKGT